MNDYSEALRNWADELNGVHLPRWEELPKLDLYMDQVLFYINDTLAFLIVCTSENGKKSKFDDKLITAAMINNYVKQGLIPKPEKKRYNREQLAYLMVYVLLKQVLPLTDIRKGICAQLQFCKNDYQKAYNLFCNQIEVGFEYVAGLTKGEKMDVEIYSAMPMTAIGTSMVALSLATKLIAQNELALIERESEEQFIRMNRNASIVS